MIVTLQEIQTLVAKAIPFDAQLRDEIELPDTDANLRAIGYVHGLRQQVPPLHGPTMHQVHQWAQEATIAHPIEPEGGHIPKRAQYIAQQAWLAARAAGGCVGTLCLSISIDKLKQAQQLNEELQTEYPNGTPQWHQHETIDDRLHDVLALLGD